MWTDSHCHLDRMDHDPVPAALSSGVRRFLVPGVTGLSDRACKLAARYPEVYLAVGTHPLFLKGRTDDPVGRIKDAVAGDRNGRIVAIGEIGLDYWQPPVNRQGQLAAFVDQLGEAARLQMPVVIHLRKAFDDFLALVGSFPGICYVMHMYSGSAEQAARLLQELPRVYFSFGGPAIRENARKIRRALAAIPVERLMIETDAPDLPPPGIAPPNSPEHLPDIGRGIAGLLGMEPGELADRTTRNGAEVFGWTLPLNDWES